MPPLPILFHRVHTPQACHGHPTATRPSCNAVRGGAIQPFFGDIAAARLFYVGPAPADNLARARSHAA